jgi:uncharacterized protein (DUF58 family)
MRITETAARSEEAAAGAILDKRRLQELGVLLPIRLSPLAFFSGRHPLGRAGEGMRFLRTRPFEPGEDNPRDIDRFSPPGEYWINEWEAEARANVMIYADVSASMQFAPKAGLMHLTLLQLTYSLWRASDRVRTVLYAAGVDELIDKRNLKTQLEQLMNRLGRKTLLPGRDALELLEAQARRRRSARDDLAFVVSDFADGSDVGAALPAWRNVLRNFGSDVVPVVISFELGADQVGAIRLWDAERGEHRLTLLTPRRIAAINAAERDRVAALQGLFRRAGLDCLVLRREQDVYPELVRLAGWRRRRRN